MNMQDELVAEYQREVALTRKMLNAIPAKADMGWKASPKSMTLGRLSAHVAETAGSWAIDTLTKDGIAFDMATYKPWAAASVAEILPTFEKDTATAAEALKDLDSSQWDELWTMSANDQIWVKERRYVVFRTWVLNHLIHHRAQLGRDLRTLGVPIPGTYGPSADEG